MGIPVKVLPIVGGGAPSEPGVPLAVGVVVVGGAVSSSACWRAAAASWSSAEPGWPSSSSASASALCPSGLWAARS